MGLGLVSGPFCSPLVVFCQEYGLRAQKLNLIGDNEMVFEKVNLLDPMGPLMLVVTWARALQTGRHGENAAKRRFGRRLRTRPDCQYGELHSNTCSSVRHESVHSVMNARFFNTEPFTPEFMEAPRLPVVTRPMRVTVKPPSGSLIERYTALKAKERGVVPSSVRRMERTVVPAAVAVRPLFPVKQALL